MLTNISWSEYSIFILVITFCYYVILLFVFYKRDIINLIENNSRIGKSSNFPVRTARPDNREKNLGDTVNISPDALKDLQLQIKSNLERANIKKFVKEEIMQSLQMVLKGHTEEKTPPYNHALNDYIQVMCENICSIHLDKVEIDQLWKG